MLVDLHIALGRKALDGGQVEEVRGAIAAARRIDPTRQKAVWPSTGNYCRGGVV